MLFMFTDINSKKSWKGNACEQKTEEIEIKRKRTESDQSNNRNEGMTKFVRDNWWRMYKRCI